MCHLIAGKRKSETEKRRERGEWVTSRVRDMLSRGMFLHNIDETAASFDANLQAFVDGRDIFLSLFPAHNKWKVCLTNRDTIVHSAHHA